MYCTECHKNFIAEIDWDINGNHVIECAWCAHEHCRVIKNGVMTEERWSSRDQRPFTRARSSWKHNSLPMETSTAQSFLRDRWMNRSDRQD